MHGPSISETVPSAYPGASPGETETKRPRRRRRGLDCSLLTAYYFMIVTCPLVIPALVSTR